MSRVVLALSAIVVVTAALVGTSMLHLNYFGSYDEVSQASCLPVVGVSGVEHAAFDSASGNAWLASNERDALPGDIARGAVLAFDADNPLAVSSWRDRTAGVPQRFEPLGLDVWRDTQAHRLFVVNAADQSVLVYTITGNGDLALIDTLSDRRMSNPNAIVAVGPKSFYVTNSTAWGRDNPLNMLDFLLGRGSGSVLYYDGNSWSEAARGLHFANGIEVSPSGDRLYVSETSAKRVRRFDRDRRFDILTAAGSVKLGMFPDNLTWNGDGTLLVGAIPKPLGFFAVKAGREETTPSALLQVQPDGEGPDTVRQVFLDNGEKFSGLTVGARIGGKLLLGAFVENKILLCDSPDPASEV